MKRIRLLTITFIFNEFTSKEAILDKLNVGGVVLSIDMDALPLGETATASAPSSSAGELSEYELLELKEATGKDMVVYKVSAHFDLEDIMASVGGVQVFSLLKNMATILKTSPSFEELMGDSVYPCVYYYVHFNQFTSKEAIIDKLNAGGVIESIDVDKVDLSKVSASATPVVIPAPAVSTSTQEISLEPVGDTKPAEVKAKKPANAAAAGSNQIIRIENRRIDYLLNLVSETVINKAALNQINAKFVDMRDQFSRMEEMYYSNVDRLGDSLPRFMAEVGLDNLAIDSC